MRRMADVYGALAQDLYSDVPLTLLLHFNELNIRHLRDVLRALRSTA